MNWEFLKMQRDGKSRQNTPVGSPGLEEGRAEVRLLNTFDARALGTARETVRAKLEDFETTLQTISQLPEQFRLVMAPIENAVNAMALLRSRLELAEENYTAEQRRATQLTADLAKIQAEVDRLAYALKSEEGSASSLRERNVALEANLNDLRREHVDLTTKITRLEPLLRETLASKDALDVELSALRQAKSQTDDMLVSLKADMSSALDELASRDNIYATLQQSHTRNGERLEEAKKAIGELEASLQSVNDKLSSISAALSRERNAARSLRSENEQLHKEREENKLQFESQIEAARARYDFVEKMLEDSRARFHEETRQLSLARRERVERDREVGRLTLAVEASQRDASELRAQVASALESSASTSALLASEIEQRRKIELEIDLLRAENSSLMLKHKSLSESARANLTTISEATNKFQSKMSQLRTENEQLRAELNAIRNADPDDGDDFDSLFEPEPTDTNIVPLRKD
ncbi:MAG: chromosome segregation ATPase-like [Beijerinckiaceae bacterium]|nr:MAG: chromosome segregation ATPase-like [Beijerinckiaceae bacterium]